MRQRHPEGGAIELISSLFYIVSSGRMGSRECRPLARCSNPSQAKRARLRADILTIGFVM